MKIVVSVHELSTETQLIIDNMRRSSAPVLIGDPSKPAAVLLSLEEYERLLRESQKPAEQAAPQPAAAEAATTPIRVAASAPKQGAQAELVPAGEHSDIAQRTASAVQADRSAAPEPRVVSQRASTAQPDPTLAAKPKTSLRGPRLTKPLPRPPGPLQVPRPRLRLSPSAIPGGWQTIAMVVGMLALGIVGFVLIVSALGG
jgi:PHD/YefM family antitoxin component YafN of YafNO toxin-antitoxin module